MIKISFLALMPLNLSEMLNLLKLAFTTLILLCPAWYNTHFYRMLYKFQHFVMKIKMKQHTKMEPPANIQYYSQGILADFNES